MSEKVSISDLIWTYAYAVHDGGVLNTFTADDAMSMMEVDARRYDIEQELERRGVPQETLAKVEKAARWWAKADRMSEGSYRASVEWKGDITQMMNEIDEAIEELEEEK